MENVKVEYWSAPWCGPCKMMVGTISELIAEGWNIEKINSDEQRDRAQAARIAAVPTFIVYKNGEAVRRFSGARTKNALLQELKLAAQ